MLSRLRPLRLSSMLVVASSVFAIDGHQDPGLQPRQSSIDPATEPKLFYTRAYHNSIVAANGKYLYIDGGEITFNDNGTIIVAPENSTYSIDLTSSWNNSTVSLTAIEKTAPVLNHETLWLDASNESFYAYNGEVSEALPYQELPLPPANQLWQFTPSGNGGTWSLVGASPTSNFTSLVRTTSGSISGSANGVGYALGGFQSWRTTTQEPFYSDSNGTIPCPGLISYNTTSQVWSNTSTLGYSTYGTSVSPALEYAPNFGPAGLLIFVGGQGTPPDVWVPGQDFFSFGSVNIFDPVSASWRSQRVSGDVIPEPRINFCSVGIQGDNGTFEVYIYGGVAASGSSNTPLDTVSVLSLPAFNWQKTTYPPIYPRQELSCNIIGNRQMVVVGGINPDNASIADPWPQGIGIFDMSDFEWKDQYNASAAPYVTPNVVKSWYKQNGRYPTSWDDPIVKAWFTQTGSNASTNSTNSTLPVPSVRPSIRSNDIGAIVGGVVGGVAGVAALALIVWYVLKRRLQAHDHVARSASAHRKAELGAEHKHSAHTSQQASQEPSELSGHQVNEAPGVLKYEMPS